VLKAILSGSAASLAAILYNVAPFLFVVCSVSLSGDTANPCFDFSPMENFCAPPELAFTLSFPSFAPTFGKPFFSNVFLPPF